MMVATVPYGALNFMCSLANEILEGGSRCLQLLGKGNYLLKSVDRKSDKPSTGTDSVCKYEVLAIGDTNKIFVLQTVC
jgi:hypothetical protein